MRITRLCDTYPYKLLRLARSPATVRCQDRQSIACELANADPASLRLTAASLQAIFLPELKAAPRGHGK
eukprot:4350799-Pyramimonas_sp.AAC.1